MQSRSLLVICTLQSHHSVRKHAQCLRMSRSQRASTMGTQLPYFSARSLDALKSKLGSKSSLISLAEVSLAAAASDKRKNPSFEFWGVKSYTLTGTLDGATTENELGATWKEKQGKAMVCQSILHPSHKGLKATHIGRNVWLYFKVLLFWLKFLMPHDIVIHMYH